MKTGIVKRQDNYLYRIGKKLNHVNQYLRDMLGKITYLLVLAGNFYLLQETYSYFYWK